MKYRSIEFTPDELREKWKDAKTHFPRNKFAFVVVWQFCMGIFPLVGINYLIYWLFNIHFTVSLWIRVFIAPFIFIINYGGYIYFMTITCRYLAHRYNKKSPPREGIFLRSFDEGGMENPELDYYHLRGVLYKWPVFFSKKSIFPWSVNYVLREIGDNKIHKNVWFGDVYVGLEYANADDGAVVLDGSSISSHVVDAIFGSLSIFEINIGKNSTVHGNIIIGPGATVSDGLAIGPRSLLPKKWKNRVSDKVFVWGDPVPMSPKNTRDSFLDLLPPHFVVMWKKKTDMFINGKNR